MTHCTPTPVFTIYGFNALYGRDFDRQRGLFGVLYGPGGLIREGRLSLHAAVVDDALEVVGMTGGMIAEALS